MNDPQQRQPEEKFLDTIVGVFANPVPTLSGVVRRRPIGQAFIVIIVVSVAQGIVQALLSRDPAQELAAVIQAIIFPVSPAFGIIFTALIALITGLYWLMSRMLGGREEYGAMFAGVGFASAPFILWSLVGLLAIPLGSGGQSLFGLGVGGDLSFLELVVGVVQLGVIIWTIILSVIVVRESNQRTRVFSTGRASAAVLIAIAAFIPIIIVFRRVLWILSAS